MQESKANSITLHDDKPQSIARLVSHLYFGEYDLSVHKRHPDGLTTEAILQAAFLGRDADFLSPKITELLAAEVDEGDENGLQDRSEIGRHVGVYIIADKYDIPGLRKKALDDMLGVIALGEHDEYIWLIIDLLTAAGVNEVEWKEKIDRYFEGYVSGHLTDQRFYEWVEERDLTERMIKAAFREGGERALD